MMGLPEVRLPHVCLASVAHDDMSDMDVKVNNF